MATKGTQIAKYGKILMKMQFYDSTLKVRLDKETLRELKKIAKKKKMPVSVLVRLLIYAELKKHRKETKP